MWRTRGCSLFIYNIHRYSNILLDIESDPPIKADLGVGSEGHVQGEEIARCEGLIKRDETHAQRGRLGLRGVRIVGNHIEAQALASPRHLATHLHRTVCPEEN